MPVNLVEVVRILRSARDILVKPGVWIKGHMALKNHRISNPDVADQVCSLGAIAKADLRAKPLSRERLSQERLTAGLILARSLPSLWRSVPSFNDSSDTTLPDVLKVFDKAIENACEAVRKEAKKQESGK
jgi:hypothetical protein